MNTMNKIGIAVAVLREFKAFLEDNSFKTTKIETKSRDVYKAIINGNEVYFLQSGYGEIDASASIEFLISKFDCNIILNYGVVGALREGLRVKTVYYVTKVVHYDFDISGVDPVKKTQYLDYSDIYIPVSDKLINLVRNIDPTIEGVVLASGDKFIVDKTIKKQLSIDYDAAICDMEGAAIARTTDKNKVDCLLIKCVSDTFGGTGEDFASNVVSSSKIAFNLIKKIINTL